MQGFLSRPLVILSEGRFCHKQLLVPSVSILVNRYYFWVTFEACNVRLFVICKKIVIRVLNQTTLPSQDCSKWMRHVGKGIFYNVFRFYLHEYMLRLCQMASVSEVVTTTSVTLFVLIYTCLNNNNRYEA